jgi:hypothetical protein
VYPVYKPVTGGSSPSPSGQTSAVQVERALPAEQAFVYVADGDKRPMLILRECERCKGTDHALLSRSLDNEQTVLLAQWFRCIKLPPNVLDEKHPFANLWTREKAGDRIPHLFFADPDGSNRRELPGDQPQSELWTTMLSYLDRCYAESAKDALKELRQLLGQYDKLDIDEQAIKVRIDKETEKNGPRSPRLKDFDADLAKVEKARTKLRAREKELRELALRDMPLGDKHSKSKGAPKSPEPKAGDAKAAQPTAGDKPASEPKPDAVR